MSRIYIVTNRAGVELRYVRANSLNGAVRAYANEKFSARIANTDEVYQAMKGGAEIMDAVAPEQVDIDDDADPGPLPQEAA